MAETEMVRVGQMSENERIAVNTLSPSERKEVLVEAGQTKIQDALHALLATVQEAAQALEAGKVVVADYAGRRVTVNALGLGRDGWVMRWSHKDYPEAQMDTIDEHEVQFIVRPQYSRYV